MPGALLGDSLDDVDQFAAAVSVLAGESHERARGDDDRPPFWALADGDAATAAELEQSLVAQRPQGAKDCVRVDPEHGREVPSGRQPLTRFRFAIGNRAAELCGDLLMELNVVVAIDLDAEHGASDTSFIGHGCQPTHPRPRAVLKALIEEARRRARKRRLIYAAAATTLLLTIAVVLALTGDSGRIS